MRVQNSDPLEIKQITNEPDGKEQRLIDMELGYARIKVTYTTKWRK